ncbi:hypothetical protein [Pseudooceanicola sp. 200-1SW]|uniref:hypothetical protein n=1 Tax=Pseudooceanicola sp. 200-1SW TaxID=3425949 RepID=UPI003D7FFB28
MSGHRHIDLPVLVLLGLSMGAGAVLDYWQGDLQAVSLASFGVALALIFYGLFLPPLLRESALRALAFIPPFLIVGALAVFVILTFAPPKAHERIYPALLAGIVVVLGWFVTFLIGEFRDERLLDRTRRDTLTALRHEIFALVDKLDNQDIWANAEKVQARILSGDDEDGEPIPYHPFATMESQPVVFEAVSGSIPTIKADTVGAIVRFYAEYTDLRCMVEDSREESARCMSPERRVSLHKQLTKRRASTLSWGLKALEEIGRDLGESDYKSINRSGKNERITSESTGEPDENV